MKITGETFILLLAGTLSHCDASGFRGGNPERELQHHVPQTTFQTNPNPIDKDPLVVPATIVPVPPPTDAPAGKPTDAPVHPPTANPKMDAKNDSYDTKQGESLKVSKPGVLDNDFGSPGDYFVKEILVLSIFQGDVDIKSNGELRYSAPATFSGREIFQYTACLEDFPEVCDSATVTIDVERDPNRPNANPVAVDDELDVDEGETVIVLAPGIFANDRVGTPSNPLVLCDKRRMLAGDSKEDEDDDDLGELILYDDGGFKYTAPTCFSGTVSFDYRACYKDYPDMKSNTATVTINVGDDKARPGKPDAKSDSYEVLEGEKLDKSAKNGLLKNDKVDSGFDLVVTKYVKTSSSLFGSFKGDLEVDDDGSFKYTPAAGELGTFTFEYEACVKGWEKCVSCDHTTVEIKVLENPDKPDSPPRGNNTVINTAIGEVVKDNVGEYIIGDTSLSLTVKRYRKSNGFKGILNYKDNGDFEYGNAPPGNESFVYDYCYTKWPDLCGSTNLTLNTTGTTNDVPQLKYAGNDGEPSTAFPLSECEYDCDKDEDCATGLICFKRGGTEVIPGCYGVDGNTFEKSDFCIKPLAADIDMNSADESKDEVVNVARSDPDEESGGGRWDDCILFC